MRYDTNLLNDFMFLKIPWKAPFPSGTKRATQRATNLNIQTTDGHNQIMENISTYFHIKHYRNQFAYQLYKYFSTGENKLIIWWFKSHWNTCDETHAVRRPEPLSSSTGIPTVSINLLSSNFNNNCIIKRQQEKCKKSRKHQQPHSSKCKLISYCLHIPSKTRKEKPQNIA